MKKKITAIVLVVLVLALLTMGMTLAYFTDEKEAENVFVFGDISIDLKEPGWQPGDDGIMDDVFPGMEFDKDPYIVNTGDASAYIRMGVEINEAVLLDLVGESAPATEAMLQEILVDLAAPGSGWTFDRMDTTADGTVIFWYNGGMLEAGLAQTSALFTAVHIPEDYKSDNVELIMGQDRIFGINVIAQAIQTVGFNTAEEAYAVLDAEYQH